MKSSLTSLAAAFLLATTTTTAHPGMRQTMAELKARTRSEAHLQGRSTRLLGDLANRQENDTSDSGSTISAILSGTASATSSSGGYTPPGSLSSDACAQDTCCAPYHLVQELVSIFQDDNGGCGGAARASIRLGFHDAATWNEASSYGGADGSIILAPEELARDDNNGLEGIGSTMTDLYATYSPHGLSAADLIQTAALTATVTCRGGPRIRSFIGRADDDTAGPTGMLPTPFQSAQELIDMFAAKTFTAADLVALVGAHTASTQGFVDASRAGASQDSTPGVWDAKYFSETRSSSNDSEVLVFPSDRNLAEFETTRGQWDVYAGEGGLGQWVPAYAQAYFRMSLLGVQNLNNMTECTKVLPAQSS